MLENKQKIAFNDVEYVEVPFQNQIIKVKPYLSLTDQVVLTEVYLEEFFSNETSSVIASEHKLMLAVLDYCTDIEVDNKIVQNLLSNYKLWKDINSKIQNYSAFRALLSQTVEEVKERKRLEKSLGNLLEKILGFFNNLTDISPESLDKIKEILSEVENSTVFKNASKIYDNKK